MRNSLYWGDNLSVLRQHIASASVDLCYIDPPFHSRRDYGAFSDKWTWTSESDEILTRAACWSNPLPQLVQGLAAVLGNSSLLAYLLCVSERIIEIHRVLKPTGVLFVHCDASASHYLKVILDALFTPSGGALRNEIIWCYSHGGRSDRQFARKHDVILFYSKSEQYTFNREDVRVEMRSGKESFGGRLVDDGDGRKYRLVYGTKNKRGETRYYKYYLDNGKVPEDWWTDINSIQASSPERTGYPTQKPEALLQRILLACSNPGDTVLDAYAGSGTTLVAAQRLGRAWIGIDVSAEAAELITARIAENFGPESKKGIELIRTGR